MAVTGPVTLAEFMQLPEVKPARELWHGVVTQKIAPSHPHSALQFEFGRQIAGAGEPGRRLRVLTKARVMFEVDTVVPDLVAYHEDRVPSDEHGELPTYSDVLPDLAVEVVSPGQTVSALQQRCREMVALGIPFVVLLVPQPRSRRAIYLFRDGRETGPLTGSDILDLDELASGLRLTVDDIFSALRARPA
jgi:Uma2 family endonuclease